MARSGFTSSANPMYKRGFKGFIKWNDGSMSYYKTRAIAKKVLRQDINKHKINKRNR